MKLSNIFEFFIELTFFLELFSFNDNNPEKSHKIILYKINIYKMKTGCLSLEITQICKKKSNESKLIFSSNFYFNSHFTKKLSHS